MAVVAEWADRLIAERDELAERIVKLRAFMRSAQFDALPAGDRSLLSDQERVMCAYLHILNDRVGRL